METISVRGVVLPRAWKRRQWIWLRVQVDGGKGSHASTDYCVGQEPLSPVIFKSLDPIWLKSNGELVLCVEIWAADTEDAVLMQFVGSCCIDSTAWMQEDPHERWYQLSQPSRTTKSAWGEKKRVASEYRISLPESSQTGSFIHVSATFRCQAPRPHSPSMNGTHEPTKISGFLLRNPHKEIRQRAMLQRVNIREIVQQNQVGTLEQLLPTTLYGKPALDTSGGRAQDLQKALTLLQLSCQYALHSTAELERYSCQLEEKVGLINSHIRHARRSHTVLKERYANLSRERDVLDCSLDGMKLMLYELEPSEDTEQGCS